MLARCFSKEEANKRAEEVHNQICEIEGAPLARRLLRAGYYWENLQRDAQEIQKNCSICKIEPTVKEAILLIEVSDWQKHYFDFFIKGIVPETKTEELRLKKHITKYMVKEGNLYRKAYNGNI